MKDCKEILLKVLKESFTSISKKKYEKPYITSWQVLEELIIQ